MQYFGQRLRFWWLILPSQVCSLITGRTTELTDGRRKTITSLRSRKIFENDQHCVLWSNNNFVSCTPRTFEYKPLASSVCTGEHFKKETELHASIQKQDLIQNLLEQKKMWSTSTLAGSFDSLLLFLLLLFCCCFVVVVVVVVVVLLLFCLVVVFVVLSCFFEILSDLNQAVPNHLADENQTRQPDTPPDHPQKSMADDAPSPALPRSSTGSKFAIGDRERCPTVSNPAWELVQRGSLAPVYPRKWVPATTCSWTYYASVFWYGDKILQSNAPAKMCTNHEYGHPTHCILHTQYVLHTVTGGKNLLLSFDCRSDWFWGFCTLPDQNLPRNKTSVLLTCLFHLVLSSTFRLSKENAHDFAI